MKSAKNLLLGMSAALLVAGAATPAVSMTQQQAKQECIARHGGKGGVRNADRTGVTVQQMIARCMKQLTGGKKN